MFNKLISLHMKKVATLGFYAMSSDKILNIIFGTPESLPFSKTGGLGEVPPGLLNALRKRGHDISMIIPQHTGSIQKAIKLGLPVNYRPEFTKLTHNVPWKTFKAEVFETELPPRYSGIKTFIVDSSEYDYFGGKPYKSLYGSNDDAMRYYFYNLVMANMIQPKKNTVFHGNDWQTAYTIALLKTRFLYKNIPALYSIHNLKYYADMPLDDFYHMTGLTDNDYPKLFSDMGITKAFSDRANPTWAALNMADMVNTVSRQYVGETLTPTYGEGFEYLLGTRHKLGTYKGVTNGVDETWYPKYDHTNFSQPKGEAKLRVQRAFGLTEDPNAMLIMMAARIDDQKGLELVVSVLSTLYSESGVNFQFALTGDVSPNKGKEIVDSFNKLIATSSVKGRIGLITKYNEELTKDNYEGADTSLVPSKFEPCGLVAPISQVNGTWPIGRKVGGMVDLIQHGKTGSLFSGDWYSVVGDANFRKLTDALTDEIVDTYKVFQNKQMWNDRIAYMMQQDRSWDVAAQLYEQLYFEMLDRFNVHGHYRAFGHF